MFESIKNQQNKPPKLAIVIPCYDEEESITPTSKRLLEVMDELENLKIIDKKSFIVFVDDGSRDRTFEVAEGLHRENKKVKCIKFSKNFGNQNAILAGLNCARELDCDCAITIDADLQQDENIIKDFIEEYNKGNEIVFGVRTTLQKGGLFKDVTSSLFYKTMWLLGAKITPNHSEYRLVSKKALDILSQYGEYELFLRGIFAEIGLKKSHIPYKTKDRKYGKTKFTWGKLLKLAIDGITSFSIVPLRFVAILGIIMAVVSFGLGVEVIYEKYFLNNTVQGWATIVVALSFFSGIQIFCIGIIGEYLGQVFKEVKARPRYIKEIELL